ncbi:MAG: hypothetical protein GX791_01990 [Synergistaceae bacterium]|nr:hypothetical protein [Synergistaceae bacterium]
MKKLFAMFLAVMLVVSLAGVALATCPPECPPNEGCPPMGNTSDSIIVGYKDVPITNIEIDKDNIALCTYIGCDPCSSNYGQKGINYTVTATGCAVRKIVGELSDNLPAHLVLAANLDAPAGATSAGWVDLSMAQKTLVSGVTKLCKTMLPMKLRLGAGADACAVDGCVTLTLTIMDQSA